METLVSRTQPTPLSPLAARTTQAALERRNREVHAEQVRLLYRNSGAAAGITVGVAMVLAYLQWGVVSTPIVLGWLICMLAISLARVALGWRYWAQTPAATNTRYWGTAFTIGTGLSAAGWGAAGFLLYPEAHLTNQVFLVFVLGGMMLGAGSILAARSEAFFAFIIPTGLPVAVRCLLQGDDLHRCMALLAAVFTAAILITTWQIYRTVRSSLNLQFENRDLVVNLQHANEQAARLNQELEIRVRARTAELHQANQRLRTEMEQRNQMEEELLRARKLEALGVLAGGIAHDFNNSLTVIQGNIGLAKLNLEPEDPTCKILDRSAAACRRAASLANQLLTFGTGGAPVCGTISVGGLIRDAVDLARTGASVGVELDIPGDLWPAEIDASQIGHALHNILINARQAVPEGGVIEVRAENIVLEAGLLPLSAGRYVRIAVRDYGCGIPPDHLPRVFDPYFTTKPAGAGLGLAAAYSIVAKHQGHITVQSTLGLETTFRIYLPAAEQPEHRKQPPDEALHSGSGRILVMDDEEPLRELVSRLLTRMGYEVVCAADGAEAIVLYEQGLNSGRGFDAVLLDLTIPGGMGGVEAAAKLREIDPSAKLIATSGYSSTPVMSECGKYGFDLAIPKPWTAAQIGALLKRALLANQAPTES